MRTRDTLLGLLVLALVVGGVWWTRARTHPGGGADAGRPPEAVAAADAALPDVTTADAFVETDGLRVTLSVAPRPPVAFATKRFRVRVTSAGGAPVVLDEGRISFEMVMPMGDHRYTLVPGDDGWLAADVVLPFCKSGNPRWYATVEGTAAGRPVTARFRLDLTKP
jgi:hypothetical protein